MIHVEQPQYDPSCDPALAFVMEWTKIAFQEILQSIQQKKESDVKNQQIKKALKVLNISTKKAVLLNTPEFMAKIILLGKLVEFKALKAQPLYDAMIAEQHWKEADLQDSTGKRRTRKWLLKILEDFLEQKIPELTKEIEKEADSKTIQCPKTLISFQKPSDVAGPIEIVENEKDEEPEPSSENVVMEVGSAEPEPVLEVQTPQGQALNPNQGLVEVENVIEECGPSKKRKRVMTMKMQELKKNRKD